MVDRLGALVPTFESISTSMAAVGDFGDKLDESSRLVTSAVERLPGTISASVVELKRKGLFRRICDRAH
jgi:hypothetical protein